MSSGGVAAEKRRRWRKRRKKEEVEKEGRKEEDGEEERRKRRDKRLIFGLLRLRGVTWSAGRGALALAANSQTEKKNPSITPSFSAGSLFRLFLSVSHAASPANPAVRLGRRASLSPPPSPPLPHPPFCPVSSPLLPFFPVPSLSSRLRSPSPSLFSFPGRGNWILSMSIMRRCRRINR